MGTVILEFLINNWPALAIVLIVGATSGYVVRKFTKWEDKHDNSHENINAKFKDNDNFHKEIIDKTQAVLNRLDAIERYLIKNTDAEYNEFTRMNSPRQLNEKGRRLFTESGSEDFLLRNKEALLRLLGIELGKIKNVTALDVESCSRRVCLGVSGNESFKDIKNYIYTHPQFEDTDITVETIAFLMGLELRNEYLKLHPEIDPMK